MREEEQRRGGIGEESSRRVSRRSFLGRGAVALGAAAAGAKVAGAGPAAVAPAVVASTVLSSAPTLLAATAGSSFLDLLRAPDGVAAYSGFAKTLPAGLLALQRSGDSWRGGSVVISARPGARGLVLTLAAPGTPVAVVQVRWRMNVPEGLRMLGDAWERSYGDLGWRCLEPARAMPWYMAMSDGRDGNKICHGYGVRTDAAALCFWQVDPEGVSLWLNVANGGNGVVLGERELVMATVASRRGVEGESSHDAVAGLCRTLAARPARLMQPIYGANDWCYSYGTSTAKTILRDTELMAELSPTGGARPFSVIDEGYHNGTADWPDMARLADEIRQRTARPGIWTRPLRAPAGTPSAILMPDARFGQEFGQEKGRAGERAYDPTHPDAQQKIRAGLTELAEWGYEMVKHDFSTYDMLGQWGFEMGPQPSLPGWSFRDTTRTNAEILTGLYRLIRESVGEAVLLDGCNTMGHLGQGHFDMQRIGDDTSGHQWERTRRMGVNTLAMRLPQDGTFYRIDPDVVGLTDAVPWELNRQWLDVLARSGAATMVSAGPPAHGAEQKAALRAAFAIAAKGGEGAKPRDWMETTAPEHWAAEGAGAKEVRYRWSGQQGTSPFLSA